MEREIERTRERGEERKIEGERDKRVEKRRHATARIETRGNAIESDDQCRKVTRGTERFWKVLELP